MVCSGIEYGRRAALPQLAHPALDPGLGPQPRIAQYPYPLYSNPLALGRPVVGVVGVISEEERHAMGRREPVQGLRLNGFWLLAYELWLLVCSVLITGADSLNRVLGYGVLSVVDGL